jgi:hypothetical protein
MIGNQVVSTMFDFDTCNHMVRFILLGDGIEDPGSYLFGPGCDGICIIWRHIDPQCILGGCAIFRWRGSTMYDWWP